MTEWYSPRTYSPRHLGRCPSPTGAKWRLSVSGVSSLFWYSSTAERDQAPPKDQPVLAVRRRTTGAGALQIANTFFSDSREGESYCGCQWKLSDERFSRVHARKGGAAQVRAGPRLVGSRTTLSAVVA